MDSQLKLDYDPLFNCSICIYLFIFRNKPPLNIYLLLFRNDNVSDFFCASSMILLHVFCEQMM